MESDDTHTVRGTEAIDVDLRDLDMLSSVDIVSLMLERDRTIVDAVSAARADIAVVAEVVSEVLAHGGRLVYVGAGTSGRIAELDAAECPPTFGTDDTQVVAVRTANEDDEDAAQAAIARLGVGPADVVLGLAASGRTPFVIAALAAARSAGATTVGFSCNGTGPLGDSEDYAIHVETGPELIAGSTRLRAGTVQKLVLNMISTAAMVRLGRTYGNLMVAMRPTNGKLSSRASGIVAEILGCTAPRADELLASAGNDIRKAVLMGSSALDAADAERRLAAAGGVLRRALLS